MKAIDLYAGIGGWALGLQMAGISIARSYEWWGPALNTHKDNLRGQVIPGDIRELDLSSLPKRIDIVVGSPPCTQFSYSNRGGSGDVTDGLRDITKFLDVVRHIRPKYWALENVPRVKSVLERELTVGGALESYRDLFEKASIEIIDMSDYGLPQKRRRCIAGNYDFDLFGSYRKVLTRLTLGDVLKGLETFRDPIYSKRKSNLITDNTAEAALNWEEERFNQDMKQAHPIYNDMSFPDVLDRPSRTVTATCTRVSRESVIIYDDNIGGHRRLSVRERSSLQGFPIDYEFQASSHAQKLKMIGNAIPPSITYLLAESFKGTPAEKLKLPSQIDARKLLNGAICIDTAPDKPGKSYPINRRFRFSIPNLRFKSGTRFELSNNGPKGRWRVNFYFGDSKRIVEGNFSKARIGSLESKLNGTEKIVRVVSAKMIPKLEAISSDSLQSSWALNGKGKHPFKLLDEVGRIAKMAIAESNKLNWSDEKLETAVENLLYSKGGGPHVGVGKVRKYAREICMGALIAYIFNENVDAQSQAMIAAE
jgi:DNA (cytosine-5)-methyltransferase 1